MDAKAVYIKYTDHCTRCHQPIADDAVMFMVRETIAWQIISGEGADAIPITNVETVPVCERCLSVKEQAEYRHDVKCLGCSHRMSITTYNPARVCSDRCAQRVRRRRRRIKNVKCTVCKTDFKTARADARFCSGQCRQWAYRLRQSTG